MIKTENNRFLTSEAWKNKGFLANVLNKNMFVIDTEGEHENCMILLHGYLRSSYDYHKILPELSKHYRVILIDFIGFGFSDRQENNYFTIIDQADYLTELCYGLDLKNITLLSHDYGSLVAKEIISRQNAKITFFDIKKVIFCNGNIPADSFDYLDFHKYYKDENSKKMISMLTSFGMYKKKMREYFCDKDKISDEELEEMWTQLSYKNGRDIINFVYHYVRERKIFWNRWVIALEHSKIPTDIIWTKNDVITDENLPSLKNDEIENQNITLIEKTGYYPMLENPEKWLKCILKI